MELKAAASKWQKLIKRIFKKRRMLGARLWAVVKFFNKFAFGFMKPIKNFRKENRISYEGVTFSFFNRRGF